MNCQRANVVYDVQIQKLRRSNVRSTALTISSTVTTAVASVALRRHTWRHARAPRTCCGVSGAAKMLPTPTNEVRLCAKTYIHLGKSCVPSSSVHIRCRAATGRPESLTLTLTLSLTLNLLNLTLSLKLTSVLTHRPSYAKWRHSSRDQSAA